MQNETNLDKSHLLIGLISFGLGSISFAFAFNPFNRITIVQTWVQTGKTITVTKTGEAITWQQVLTINSNGSWNHWKQEVSTWPIQSVLKLHNDKATEIAKFMERRKDEVNNLWQKRDVMMASYMQESGLNPRAKWQLGEMWMCQLMQNKTNNKWLKNPLWNDWKRQADRCIDKRIAVSREDKWTIWASYGSNEYKKYLHYFQN